MFDLGRRKSITLIGDAAVAGYLLAARADEVIE
jgi:hypothetical protein